MNIEKTAFIFDVDGTLVHTEIQYAQIISQYLSEHGILISPTEYMNQFSGKSFEVVLTHANQLLKSKAKPQLNIPQAISEIDNRYTQSLLNNGIKSTPGSLELIQALHAHKIQKAIGSNAPLHAITDNLTASGHIDFFNSENIFSAFQINKWKPEPNVFQAAYNSLHTPQIETIIILEDSLSGLIAIQNFSLQMPELEIIGVFIDNGHNTHLHSQIPDTVQYSFCDLRETLNLFH